MKLAVVAAIGSYSAADLEKKARHLKSVLHPSTEVDLFTAASGAPYVESSFELYLTEVAVARTVVEIAARGYDAIVGTAFLDNGLDGARDLVDIPVVGPAKPRSTWRLPSRTDSPSSPRPAICPNTSGHAPRVWASPIASWPFRRCHARWPTFSTMRTTPSQRRS
jgi:hypothetical protein